MPIQAKIEQGLPLARLDGTVKIGARKYTFRELYETESGQHLLIRLRGKAGGSINCLCQQGKPLPLQVYSTPEGARLRCYPDTGPLHFLDCLRNGISHVGGGSTVYTSKAISRDGRFWSFHLRDHLIDNGALRGTASDPTNARNNQEGKNIQGRATLLATLRAIWQITGLNGTVRKFGSGSSDMLAATRIAEHRGLLLFNGMPAREVCILPGVDRIASHPRLADPRQGEATKYAIVIGTVAKVERAGEDALITFRNDALPIRVTREVWSDIVTRSPFPRTDTIIKQLSNDAQSGSLRITLIGRLVRDKEKAVRLVNGALMVVASYWPIPVGSRAELQVLWNLSDGRGRRFIKPLLYRMGDLVLPDYLLLDCELPTAIEVYGRSGSADYDRHSDFKRTVYAANRDRIGYVELIPRKGAMLLLPDRKHGAFERNRQLVDGLEIRLGLKLPSGAAS